jgi:hypothetical protein
VKHKTTDIVAAGPELQNSLRVAEVSSLPVIIDRASAVLANARGAAEILEARSLASVAYDLAKKAARLAKAKGAHDDLVAAAHRMQADALEIEAGAKRRLADEYDAAQERGEVVGAHDGATKRIPDGNAIATVTDIGLSSKEIHEARLIRDAENADPGIVERTVNEAVAAGEEPTKAKVRNAARKATRHRSKPRPRLFRAGARRFGGQSKPRSIHCRAFRRPPKSRAIFTTPISQRWSLQK